MPKRARKYFCFLLDWCAPVISITKEATFEHVLAKALLPKAALVDCSAPGLSKTATLGLELAVKDLPWAEHSDDGDNVILYIWMSI